MRNHDERIYGDVPEDWRVVCLGDLIRAGQAELQTGPFGTALHASAYRAVGTPVVAVQHIGENKLKHEDLPHVDEETVNRLSRYKLCENDILFGRKGAVERRALIRKEEVGWLQGSDCIRLRLSGGVDATFVSYVLGSRAHREWILRHAHGATMPSLNQEILSLIPLPLPPVGTQRAIAHILGTLDDKIELNRRMNETLEAMARSLFKSWFVDFDPVRAKAEGRLPAGRQATTGLPKEISDLFPDSFEDSELGEIPKGWRVTEVGEIAEVIDCLHSKKPERRDSGRPLLQLWNIRDDGLIDMADIYYIDEADYKNWVSRMEASAGDCVITNVGRVGAVAQIPEGFNAALGRNMTGVRCKPTFRSPTFLIECLLSQAMRNEIVLKIDTGTILDALNVRNIPKLRLVLPRQDLLIKFEELTRPLRARMECNLTESRTLAALRDALLPKLISGELRVKDAERFLEGAV